MALANLSGDVWKVRDWSLFTGVGGGGATIFLGGSLIFELHFGEGHF